MIVVALRADQAAASAETHVRAFQANFSLMTSPSSARAHCISATRLRRTTNPAETIQESACGLPMEKEMPTVSLTNQEELACTKCGRRASFLSPVGPLCPTDALIAATFNEWIPMQIRMTVDGIDLPPSSV
jgi:hypothetical protein